MDLEALPETGIVLPEYASWPAAELVSFGVDASDAGFGSIWCGETWGTNPFPLLATLCDRIDRPIGTVIANAFARSPSALATNAITLHELSGGRFVLGIGASTPPIVEGFHGASYDRPLRRLRETIEIVRLALDGEPISYDGDCFQLDGFSLSRSLDPGESVPIFNAALGPTNIALTSEYADGWLPHLVPREGIEPRLREGAVEGAGPVHVAPSVVTSVHPDGDRAREILRRHLAYYLGASPFYRSIVGEFGFESEAEAIDRAWSDSDRDAAAAAVSEDLMRAVGIVGTPGTVAEQYDRFRRSTADTVLISFPREVTPEMADATVDAFADVLESTT